MVPDGVYLDADGLAEIDLGNGTNYNPQEALNMFFQTGSVIGRSFTSEGDLNPGKIPIQEITRPDAWVLIMFFSIFLYYIFRQATKPKKNILWLKKKEPIEDNVKKLSKWKSIVYTVWGLAWLVLWWKLIVDWAVSIAQSYNIPNSFIWVTIIAIWTSLPELASSVIAALKKNTDMAIGWIIGSNIFNSLWILWATWTIMPLKAYSWVELDAYFNIFAVIIVIILLSFSKKKFEINKKWWILLVLLYFSYIWYLIWSL